VIVDQKGGQNLLYLPLDRLMQLSTQSGPVAVDSTARAISPGDVTPQPIPEPLPSRRESLRSRDRESGR